MIMCITCQLCDPEQVIWLTRTSGAPFIKRDGKNKWFFPPGPQSKTQMMLYIQFLTFLNAEMFVAEANSCYPISILPFFLVKRLSFIWDGNVSGKRVYIPDSLVATWIHVIKFWPVKCRWKYCMYYKTLIRRLPKEQTWVKETFFAIPTDWNTGEM